MNFLLNLQNQAIAMAEALVELAQMAIPGEDGAFVSKKFMEAGESLKCSPLGKGDLHKANDLRGATKSLIEHHRHPVKLDQVDLLVKHYNLFGNFLEALDAALELESKTSGQAPSFMGRLRQFFGGAE